MGDWGYISKEELITRISLITLDTICEISSSNRRDVVKAENIDGVRVLCEYLIDHIRTDKAKQPEGAEHDEG